jgi:hypothetical protein
VFFARDGVYYHLRGESGKPELARPAAFRDDATPAAWNVQLEFLDPSPNVRLRAGTPSGAVVSYFRGPGRNSPAGLTAYSTLVYEEIWPGIDLAFAGPEGNLKYTFHVKPGADPSRIRLAYRGAARLNLDRQGGLRIETPLGGFLDDRPLAWQDSDGVRRTVDVAFQLKGEVVTFKVGGYDPAVPLVLDPVVLVYSGFVSGYNHDYPRGVAVDAAGNAYVTGYTSSDEFTFPVTVGPDLTKAYASDAFVAKVNAQGTGFVYVGYIGGDGFDQGMGITVDNLGQAYVAGYTDSTEATFPVKGGPDLTHNGMDDAFVVKVNAEGTGLVYAGYIGGSSADRGFAVAVDNLGHAYVAGMTVSTASTFPVTVGPDLTRNNSFDGFLAKVNPAGNGLVYASYIGGDDEDVAYGVAADQQGNAYVVGYTKSSETSFPVIIGPDVTHNSPLVEDAFIVKVSATGTQFLYAGYIGGLRYDLAYAVTVDPSGAAYVAGETLSSETQGFPVTVGPGLTHSGATDVMVAKVNPSGTGLVYAGYIGGRLSDLGYGIAVDKAGNAFVTGETLWLDEPWATPSFPAKLGPALAPNVGTDVFVTKITAAGTRIVHSGFVGGLGEDIARGIAVDSSGGAYIAGTAYLSTWFPLIVGPNLLFNTFTEGFVTKISAFPGNAGPMLAFRNGFNAIEINTFPSPALRNSGGNFRLDPALAMSGGDRAFFVARDSGAGVWLNYLTPEDTFNGWVFAGGNTPGRPALAVAGETAWIAIRDPWNSYSVRSYTPGAGFGAWTWLQGILATTPELASCPNGDVYVTGKDNWNGLWTRRLSAGGAWNNWRYVGGIVSGTPAIACGSDNAAYIAVRDMSNNMWLARVVNESSNSWHYGAGIWDGDLQIAANGNLIQVAGLSASAPWYRSWQVGTGWQSDWLLRRTSLPRRAGRQRQSLVVEPALGHLVEFRKQERRPGFALFGRGALSREFRFRPQVTISGRASIGVFSTAPLSRRSENYRVARNQVQAVLGFAAAAQPLESRAQ